MIRTLVLAVLVIAIMSSCAYEEIKEENIVINNVLPTKGTITYWHDGVHRVSCWSQVGINGNVALSCLRD